MVIEQKVAKMLGICTSCNVQPCQCDHGASTTTTLRGGPAYTGGSMIDTSSIDPSFNTSREKTTVSPEEEKFEPLWNDEDSW